MDVYEIRKSNLLLLEAETKSLKVIGDAMVRVVQNRGEDRAPDYQNVLSQHKGKKRIGAQTARLIEEAMKKPQGWMDVLQVDQAMEAKEAGQIAMNIASVERAKRGCRSAARSLLSRAIRVPGFPSATFPLAARRKNAAAALSSAMALVECKECGAQVSQSAKACPNCGAPPPKRTSLFTWVVGGLFALMVVSCIISTGTNDEKAAVETKRVATLTPEQRAAEAAARRAAQERDTKTEAAFQVAQRAAHTIRQSANDPKSIEWTELSYADNGAILIEFRGRNAFNAMIKQMAVVTPDGKLAAGSERDSLVIKTYNQHIAGKTLYHLPKPPQ